MRNLTNYLLAGLLIIGTACGSGKSGKDSGKDKGKDTTAMKKKEKDDGMKHKVMEKGGLKVYPIKTKNFPDAKLSLKSPGKMELEPGKTKFEFNVKNFELKTGTPDAAKHGLAESDKGQHIHFIVDNGPYNAKYEPSFEYKLDKGYHTILAFLSRSYHESVKNSNAYVLKQFKVGDAQGEKADLSKPQLFYSRPKGTYKGNDFKKLLLDFYPVNIDSFSKNGYHVRAIINGTKFTFTEWKPYVIEGLSAGELTVKLELLNKNGKLVDSKFNKVTRTVSLKPAEQQASKEGKKGDKKSS